MASKSAYIESLMKPVHFDQAHWAASNKERIETKPKFGKCQPCLFVSWSFWSCRTIFWQLMRHWLWEVIKTFQTDLLVTCKSCTEFMPWKVVAIQHMAVQQACENTGQYTSALYDPAYPITNFEDHCSGGNRSWGISCTTSSSNVTTHKSGESWATPYWLS